MKATILMLIAVLLGVLVLVGMLNGCGADLLMEVASLPNEPEHLFEPLSAPQSDEMSEEDKTIVYDLKTLSADELGDLHETPDEPEMEQVEEPVEETEDAAEPDVSKNYYGSCRITFYDDCELCCGVWAGGNTASGVRPTVNHTVANGSLPFGTRLLIDGQEYVVEDRGVGEFEIDIFVATHEEALQRGLYYSEVYILD